MGTMTLTGGAVLTYTSETWGTAPAAAYSAWCASLGVSDTGTDVAIDGDDDAFSFALQSPFFTSGPGQVFYSTEAGVGLFLGTPTTTAATEYTSLGGLSRFFGTTSQPIALLTYHPADDLKSYNGKVRKSGGTTLIFAQHSNYDNESISRYDCAIKITPQSIELIGTTTDVSASVNLFELVENDDAGSSPVVQSATVQNQNAATTYRYTITTPAGSGDPEGIASAPSPLGTPSAIGRATVQGIALNTSPLGIPRAVGQAFGSVTGLASAIGPLGAYHGTGLVVIAGKSSASGPLQNPRATGLHDFTKFVSGALVNRYVMDLTTPSGTVRLPISSWQATLQTGISNYVQCVIPACLPFVSAIESATSFTISRRAPSSAGGFIEYPMADAPATSRSFDKGPERYTCTLSGYAPGFDAGTGDQSAAYNRTLQGVRSISTTDTSIRARAAIDWLLRPGHRCTADGVDFVVSFINYYVNNTDAYMDCGGQK